MRGDADGPWRLRRVKRGTRLHPYAGVTVTGWMGAGKRENQLSKMPPVRCARLRRARRLGGVRRRDAARVFKQKYLRSRDLSDFT